MPILNAVEINSKKRSKLKCNFDLHLSFSFFLEMKTKKDTIWNEKCINYSFSKYNELKLFFLY